MQFCNIHRLCSFTTYPGSWCSFATYPGCAQFYDIPRVVVQFCNIHRLCAVFTTYKGPNKHHTHTQFSNSSDIPIHQAPVKKLQHQHILTKHCKTSSSHTPTRGTHKTQNTTTVFNLHYIIQTQISQHNYETIDYICAKIGFIIIIILGHCFTTYPGSWCSFATYKGPNKHHTQFSNSSDIPTPQALAKLNYNINTN